MIKITYTELKKKLDYYLNLSSNEDIFITKNNRVISILTNPADKSFYEFMKMGGCLKQYDDGRDYDDIIGDAIMERNA